MTLGAVATILAGLLIGWTIGLIEADLVERRETLIFLALALLLLGALIGFVLESVLIDRDST